MTPSRTLASAAADAKSRREDVATRRNKALSIAAPALVAVLAIAGTSAPSTPGAATACVALAFFALNVLGVAAGLHRHFAHHAFKARPWLRAALGVFGTWALQGPVTTWVADHRRHHRFADRPHDPHSPWADESGPIAGRWRGWWHAHFAWMLSVKATDARRYAPDALADPLCRWLTRRYWVVAATGQVAPWVVGLALGGTDEAWRCLLWAGGLRVMLLHQLTWSVNSFGHMVGRRHPAASDESRDSWLLALLLLGEGLHAHHHAHPTHAVLRPKVLDATGALLRGLRRLGWVRDLRGAE